MVIGLEHFHGYSTWSRVMNFVVLCLSFSHVVSFLASKTFEAKLLPQNSLALGVFLKRGK